MNEIITPEWLRQHGAFENQNELVISGSIVGFQCQFRFGSHPFDQSRISQWCLVPSTGDGRIWLPTSIQEGPFDLCVPVARFHALALLLGVNFTK